MSWKATAYVKNLTHHADGTRLSAREKLILFVLADSHNENQDNCAWIGVQKAAKSALTSHGRFVTLIQRLESKGTIQVKRRPGLSSLYYFPALAPVPELDDLENEYPSNSEVEVVQPRVDDTRPTAIGREPICNHQEEEPIGVAPTPSVEKFEREYEAKRQRKLDKENRRKGIKTPQQRQSPVAAEPASKPIKPPETWNQYAIEYTRCSDGIAPICQARDLATFGDLLEQIRKNWYDEPITVLLRAFKVWAGNQMKWSKWSSRGFIETEAWPIIETLDDPDGGELPRLDVLQR